MPRLNVSKVLSNPQFKDSFTVNRQTGTWENGRFAVNSPVSINMTGAVVPGGTKDINQVPEGDRTSEIMIFLSTQPLYVSSNYQGTNKGTSDQITWQNTTYRLYQVKNWSSYGYYRAIGVSMAGD